MTTSAFMFPLEFSWLSPAYRPSAEEVSTYAKLIATREGVPQAASHFRRQAELQLWVWRNETHQRPPRRRAGVEPQRASR